jgi:hypothetical protein
VAWSTSWWEDPEMNIEIMVSRFAKFLRRRRKSIAPLQFVARLENYLAFEFVRFLHGETKGRHFALTNWGGYGQQKYDVVVLTGTGLGPADAMVTHVLQCKYLGNRHRAFPYSATGALPTALRDLARQLSRPPGRTHGPYSVASNCRNVYALVFASHVRKRLERDESAAWYSKALAMARSPNVKLRDFDFPDPRWRVAYEDQPVRVLCTDFCASLKIGFWRR